MLLKHLNERAIPKNSSLDKTKLNINGRDEEFRIKLTDHSFDVRADNENMPKKDRKEVDNKIQKDIDDANAKNEKAAANSIKCKLDKHDDTKCNCYKKGVLFDTTPKDWTISKNKCKVKTTGKDEDEGVSRIDILNNGEITRALKIGLKAFLKEVNNSSKNLLKLSKDAGGKNLHLNLYLGEKNESDSSGSRRKIKTYSKIIFAVNRGKIPGTIEVAIITVFPIDRVSYPRTTAERFSLNINI